jgi:hypothetical protein
VKSRFGVPLKKRLDHRRETETLLKLVAHDVRRVGYLEVFEDITSHWPRKGSAWILSQGWEYLNILYPSGPLICILYSRLPTDLRAYGIVRTRDCYNGHRDPERADKKMHGLQVV